MHTTIFSQNGQNIQELSALELRLRLLDRGYSPIPVVGKKPTANAWQSGLITPDRINSETALYAGATNTGLRADQFPVVDIDLWDDEHVGVAVGLGPVTVPDVDRVAFVAARVQRQNLCHHGHSTCLT